MPSRLRVGKINDGTSLFTLPNPIKMSRGPNSNQVTIINRLGQFMCLAGLSRKIHQAETLGRKRWWRSTEMSWRPWRSFYSSDCRKTTSAEKFASSSVVVPTKGEPLLLIRVMDDARRGPASTFSFVMAQYKVKHVASKTWFFHETTRWPKRVHWSLGVR